MTKPNYVKAFKRWRDAAPRDRANVCDDLARDLKLYPPIYSRLDSPLNTMTTCGKQLRHCVPDDFEVMMDFEGELRDAWLRRGRRKGDAIDTDAARPPFNKAARR